MKQTSLLDQPAVKLPHWLLYVKEAEVKDGRTRFLSVVSTGTGDRDGEVLEPAGARFAERIPLIWSHKGGRDIEPHHVLGKVESHEVVGNEVRTVASINDGASTVHATAAKLVRDGDLVNLSHGFEPFLMREPDGKEWRRERGDPYPPPLKGRQYLEWEMQEQSIVPIGSNMDAHILGMKGLNLLEGRVPGGGEGTSPDQGRSTEGTPGHLEDWEAESIKQFGLIIEPGLQWRFRCSIASEAERLRAELTTLQRTGAALDLASVHEIKRLAEGLLASAKRAD